MAQRRSGPSRRQQSVDYPRYPPQSTSQTQPAAVQAPQLQPVSDYESDYQGYSSDYPTKPPPANRTNEELNLSVLKRYNPEISSILSIAPYAVVYEFSPIPEPTWSKTGVEGTLFICQLTPGAYKEDRYIAIVLNRRGLDNFEAELREGENAGVEITDEYVIISFKDGHEQKIYGVFIFSEGPGTSTEQTRTLNAELMKTLAMHAAVSRQAAEAAAASATAQPTNGYMQPAEQSRENQHGSVPMGRQISLQQLFGQQRAEDASWSVRAHNLDGTTVDGPVQTPATGVRTQLEPQASSQQPDILGDLFRRAGLGMR